MSKLFKTERKITPAHITKEASLTLSKDARKAMSVGQYVPPSNADERVKSGQDDLFKRKPYKVGDGDPGTYVPRPGSLVAFTLPSRGIRT